MSSVAPGIFHLSNVRTSYLYAFKPFIGKPTPQNPNPKPVFTCHFLMAKEHPDLARFAAHIEAVGSSFQWKNGMTWDIVKEALKAQDKLCLHRGDVTKAGQPEYAGLYFVSGNNSKRFTVVDGDRTPLTEADGRPYSGCYVNAIVDVWCQDNTYGRRVNCTITGIQFLRHGDAFGGGAQPAQPDEFGVVDASADAATLVANAEPMAGLL